MADHIAQCLSLCNITAIFAVPGVPITETLTAIRRKGETHVVVMRNEQTAAQAAALYGFQTGSGTGYGLQEHSTLVEDVLRFNETAATQLRAVQRLLSSDIMKPTPGVCFTTCGPAFTNALSGVTTAHANSWPMILISSSNGDQSPVAISKFQEYPQIKIAEGMVAAGVLKGVFAARTHEELMPCLKAAVELSLSGMAGPVYLDVHWSLFRTSYDKEPSIGPKPPTLDAPPVHAVASAFKAAERPLLVLGDELNYAMGSMARLLIQRSASYLPNCVILTTPMSKGLVMDQDKRNGGAARTHVLRNASVVVAIGASLNWQFEGPWMDRPDLTDIYVLSARPHCNRERAKCISGNSALMLVRFLKASQSSEDKSDPCWVSSIHRMAQEAALKLLDTVRQEQAVENLQPATRRWHGGLKLNTMFDSLTKHLQPGVPRSLMSDEDTASVLALLMGVESLDETLVNFVCEGATSMDRSRLFLKSVCARCRFDAAQFGAMGVGTAFAISTAVYRQTLIDKASRVLGNVSDTLGQALKNACVTYLLQGDSAFGFSGLEFETIRRYNLPVAICVIDNGGMYAMEEEPGATGPQHMQHCIEALRSVSVTDLTVNFQFDKLGEAAYLPHTVVTHPFRQFVEVPSLIRIIVDPSDGSKQGHMKQL